jgi:prevent-host-death family protein
MCYVMRMSSTRPDPHGGAGTASRPRAGPAARRIGIRELRQHASVYVDLAEKGYTVDITNRGRLVAQLVPVADPESPLERLVAEGIIVPAEEPGNLLAVAPAPRVPAGKPTASAILMRTREKERY